MHRGARGCRRDRSDGRRVGSLTAQRPSHSAQRAPGREARAASTALGTVAGRPPAGGFQSRCAFTVGKSNYGHSNGYGNTLTNTQKRNAFPTWLENTGAHTLGSTCWLRMDGGAHSEPRPASENYARTRAALRPPSVAANHSWGLRAETDDREQTWTASPCVFRGQSSTPLPRGG